MDDQYLCIVYSFDGYGLNKYRNFLSMPENTLGYIYLKDEEVFDLCTSLLKEHGCEESCIFLITSTGNMFAVINIPNMDDQVEIVGIRDYDPDFIREMDSEYRLCCYGLMIEKEPEKWVIIEN